MCLKQTYAHTYFLAIYLLMRLCMYVCNLYRSMLYMKVFSLRCNLACETTRICIGT